MRYAWQDTTLGNLDLPLHAKKFEKHLHARLGWKNLGDDGLDAAEGSLQNLHLAAHLDMGADFHSFLIDHSLSQGFDDLFPHDGSDAAKFHNMRDSVTGSEMAVRSSIVEAGEQITREHGLPDTHPTSAARALEAQHWTKNLRSNVPQNAPLSSGFLAGFALYAEPIELLTFKTCHG